MEHQEQKKKGPDQNEWMLLLALSFCQCNPSLVTAGSPHPAAAQFCAVSRLAAAGWLALPQTQSASASAQLNGQLLPVFRIYPGASLMLEARSRAAV
ncbi:uncharacterized protein K444DRAFT_613397 [Hyaloscypha bicolor E]|jgi:hypothetical protein|uniref:Uncharacterized protein n=1 Tax=Hyaloscypha bicolor E TaxID=1095630 RepID=A0A2J6T8U0_9HELO|nr:uncharacterized protein K444DRAFT_613397 [Hyaloscypha bicolor E]PMD59432.1 hypothetical protein K444DRAFT_613397 [Hyaloscypha bicolor E]